MPSIVPRSSSHSATSVPHPVQETSTSSTSNTPTPTPTRLRTGSVLVTSDSQSQFAVSLAEKYDRESGASSASTSTARPRRSTQHAPSRPAPYTTAALIGSALTAFGLGGLGREGLWPTSNPSSGDSDKATTMGMAEQTFAKATTLSFSSTSDQYKQGADWLDQAAESTPPPKPEDDDEATVEDEAEPTQEPEHEAEPEEQIKVVRHRRSVDGVAGATTAAADTTTLPSTEATTELPDKTTTLTTKPLVTYKKPEWGLFTKPTVVYFNNKGAFMSWVHMRCNVVPKETKALLNFKYDPTAETTSLVVETSSFSKWNVLHIPAGAGECFIRVYGAGRVIHVHNLRPGEDKMHMLDLGNGYELAHYDIWGSLFWANGGWQDPRTHSHNYDWAKEMFRTNPEGCIVMTVDSSCRNGFPLPNQHLVKNVCFNPAVALVQSRGREGFDNCGLNSADCLKTEGVKHNVYMDYGSSRGTIYTCRDISKQDVENPYRFNGWKYT